MANLFGVPTATAYLKPRKARPFFYRHPWVYSGAIARVEGECDDGDLIRLCDEKGQFIANGYINSQSQIAVRLLSWDESRPIDEHFFREKLVQAKALREDVLAVPTGSNAWRAFFSEADGLPGLIVDRYTDFLVAQVQTLGMHLRRDVLVNLLDEIYGPSGIFEKSDPEMLEREGVAYQFGSLRGAEPPDSLRIECDGMAFNVNIRGGQKTGFFLDQRENRKVAAWYAAGRRVLDCFCHTGAFAIYCAKLGKAERVLGIDSSAAAVALAVANAELNDVRTAEFRTGKLPETLRHLRAEGELFDMIILDPPQFARTRLGLKKALFAYRELNASAMRCTEHGGILVTCSCSQHVSDDEFEQMLNEAAYEAGRPVQVLERRSQASDHPVIVSCPETRYLKCYVCRVM